MRCTAGGATVRSECRTARSRRREPPCPQGRAATTRCAL